MKLRGGRLVDWEDLAAGPCPAGSCLYVADIGDNREIRKHVTVYRVPEPDVGDRETAHTEAFHATFPDGPRDAEALFALPDGGLYIVSKGVSGPVTLYRFPQPLHAGSTVRLEKVRELSAGAPKRKDRVTGADAEPSGRWVAIRTLRTLSFYRASDLVAGRLGKPLRFDLGSLGEAQGEAVAFAAGRTLYLTSEGGGGNQRGTLSRLSCALPR